VTSSMMGVLIPIHPGDAWRIPTSMRSQAIAHELYRTSCHSRKTPYQGKSA
jgi:hypothetical protein